MEILHYNFMQNALMATALVSIAAGMIGALIVANRLVFISGGIAHSAYGGVGLAYYSGIPPLLGALLFTIPMACIMGVFQERLRERSETLIGILWAGGMALGVVLLDLTPGYKPDLMSFLFGSILTVPHTDLWMMLALDFILFIFLALFYQQILSVSIDAEFAATRALPVLFFRLLILAMVALSVVLLMRVTGLVLMIALLTVPAAIASRWIKNLKHLMLVSGLLTFAICLGGIIISYFTNLSSGATIILLACLLYLINLLALAYGDKKRQNKAIQDFEIHTK